LLRLCVSAGDSILGVSVRRPFFGESAETVRSIRAGIVSGTASAFAGDVWKNKSLARNLADEAFSSGARA